MFPIPLVGEKEVGIQLAYFGNIDMKQFVVTTSGLLILEDLVAVDGAVRFLKEDNIESGNAQDVGHVVKRIFRIPPGLMPISL